MDNDAADLAIASQGGPDAHRAFARLYDRHAPVVLALCRRRTPGGMSRGTSTEADDALQETFIRAFRMLGRLDDPTGFRHWLYAIARNVCNERRRSAGRRAKHEQGAAVTHAQRLAATEPIDAVVEQAAHHEQLERLDNAIEELPERERLAIHLFYLDPNPIDAAQSALGLSRSGFYKLLANARQHLSTALAEAQA